MTIHNDHLDCVPCESCDGYGCVPRFQPAALTIGGRVARARLAARLTQSQVAAAFNPPKSPNTISRWETGTYSMSLADVEETAKILNTDPAALVGWTVEKEPDNATT